MARAFCLIWFAPVLYEIITCCLYRRYISHRPHSFQLILDPPFHTGQTYGSPLVPRTRMEWEYFMWRPPENGVRIFYVAAARLSGGRHIIYSHSILVRGTNGLPYKRVLSAVSLLRTVRMRQAEAEWWQRSQWTLVLVSGTGRRCGSVKLVYGVGGMVSVMSWCLSGRCLPLFTRHLIIQADILTRIICTSESWTGQAVFHEEANTYRRHGDSWPIIYWWYRQWEVGWLSPENAMGIRSGLLVIVE